MFLDSFPTCSLQADKRQLAELRQYQQRVRLGDDVAADIVKEAARARLEAALDAAVEVTKRRTRQRDYTDAMAEVQTRLPLVYSYPCLFSAGMLGRYSCSAQWP